MLPDEERRALESELMLEENEAEYAEARLRRLEQELYDHYYQLGKSLLELAEQEQRQISKIIEKIIEARNRLAVAKEEKSCPYCMTFNDSDSVFCKRCGQKL